MKCTKCNAELIEGSKFCTKCGTPAPEPKPEVAGNKCSKCNAELVPGAKFCTKCGTPAPEPESVENKCSKCGAILAPEAKFCTKCGTATVVVETKTEVQEEEKPVPVEPEVVEEPVVPAEPEVVEEPVAVAEPEVVEAPVAVAQQSAPVATTQATVQPKEKKGNGNAGWIVAIIIMCFLLITVIGVGIYFIIINPDALDSLDGKEEKVETVTEDVYVENDREEVVAEEPVQEEVVEEEPIVEEPVEEEVVLKDYENPDYMYGPTSLGRSDRVSVLEFVAPVPDDSIEQPADGSIPVQYFDPSIHEYELFIEDVNFYEASQRCEEMGGHLATIICKEELVMVQDLLRQSGYNQREVPYIIWLGAYIDQSTGMYAWCTGEGIGISNWMPGEPTGTDPETGEKEEYILMMYDAATDQWVWVDESYDITEQYAGNIAYLCEWEVITDPNYYEDLKTR